MLFPRNGINTNTMTSDYNGIGLYNHFPGIMAWEKDCKSVFKNASFHFTKAWGFKQSENIIECTDYDLPHLPTEAWPEIWQQGDSLVAHANKEIKFFEIINFTGELRQYLVTKVPKLDVENNIVGTYGCSVDITQLFLQVAPILIRLREQEKNLSILQSYFIGKKPGINLTNRQSECLFFTLWGKTCKEIAKILNLSPRTVECHIEVLKSKFNCGTRKELIEKATSQGFLNVIPQRLFNQQLSVVLG